MSGKWTIDTDQNDDCFHITGENWDEEALLILMNIIHGHTQEVPRTVDLELLTRMAEIVDYYELHEASGF